MARHTASEICFVSEWKTRAPHTSGVAMIVPVTRAQGRGFARSPPEAPGSPGSPCNRGVNGGREWKAQPASSQFQGKMPRGTEPRISSMSRGAAAGSSGPMSGTLGSSTLTRGRMPRNVRNSRNAEASHHSSYESSTYQASGGMRVC